jgi:hypothetical protein
MHNTIREFNSLQQRNKNLIAKVSKGLKKSITSKRPLMYKKDTPIDILN